MDLKQFRQKRVVAWSLFVLATAFMIFLVLLATRFYLEWQVVQDATKDSPSVSAVFGQIFGKEGRQSRSSFEKPKNLPEEVSRLTGETFPVGVSDQIIAVMIENFPSSRPQMRGLPEASIVYEVLTEGGITRYLALFDHQDLKKVGPVRSARPYFVDWAGEYGGAYVHAGGSSEALRQLVKAPVRDFDEDGELVYRDFRFMKPHNLFVNITGVKEFLDSRNWHDGVTTEWFDFAGKLPASALLATKITLDFSFPEYRVTYDYDPGSKTYRRFLGGTIHTDELGNPVRPRNIIVQFTEYTVIDDEGRLKLRTKGTGMAWYFTAGQYFQGTWQQTGSSRTEFLDDTGKPISLSPGQTWIEVIKKGGVIFN